jgi:hypothetical protein
MPSCAAVTSANALNAFAYGFYFTLFRKIRVGQSSPALYRFEICDLRIANPFFFSLQKNYTQFLKNLDSLFLLR